MSRPPDPFGTPKKEKRARIDHMVTGQFVFKLNQAGLNEKLCQVVIDSKGNENAQRVIALLQELAGEKQESINTEDSMWRELYDATLAGKIPWRRVKNWFLGTDRTFRGKWNDKTLTIAKNLDPHWAFAFGSITLSIKDKTGTRTLSTPIIAAPWRQPTLSEKLFDHIANSL